MDDEIQQTIRPGDWVDVCFCEPDKGFYCHDFAVVRRCGAMDFFFFGTLPIFEVQLFGEPEPRRVVAKQCQPFDWQRRHGDVHHWESPFTFREGDPDE